MGRKRKDAVKVNVNLRVEPDLLAELNELGINKSNLFETAARAYIRKYRLENSENISNDGDK